MRAIEAIVLKAKRFQEHKHILTLFSKECGIISVIATARKQAFSPLLKVEVELMPSEKELKKCKAVQIVGSYQALRLSLEKLQRAAMMLDFVEKELPTDEPVEELYELLEMHLVDMCEAENSRQVADSFYRQWKLFQGEI